MTLWEAAETALKELGISEPEIKARILFADTRTPAAIQLMHSQMQLKPGATERQVIDGLKKAYAIIMKAHPKQVLDSIKSVERNIRKQSEAN